MSGAAADLVSIRKLRVTFDRPRAFFGRTGDGVRAVDGVDLAVAQGATLGLVGESGSGKTTTGRAILRLVRASEGSIRVGRFDVTGFGRQVPVEYRKAVQAVFQDPFGSLNPRMMVGDIIGESLQIHFQADCKERRRKTAALLDRVGIAAQSADRYPHEFSGGQRQRIAIAKALAVEPDLIVLDEPVSALDVSVQSQIINLLEDLQESVGVTYLLISHDLAVVRHACQRIAVMFRGRIIEVGTADDVCDRPMHPYTKMLIAAAPTLDLAQQDGLRARRKSIPLSDSTDDLGKGCSFAQRCPSAWDRCRVDIPTLNSSSDDHRAACHLYSAETHTDDAGQSTQVMSDDSTQGR